MITIPSVTQAELGELLSGLKASGSGTVQPIDAFSGSFAVHHRVAFVTVHANGSYKLLPSGELQVTCDHYEDKVGDNLRDALASIRGGRP